MGRWTRGNCFQMSLWIENIFAFLSLFYEKKGFIHLCHFGKNENKNWSVYRHIFRHPSNSIFSKTNKRTKRPTRCQPHLIARIGWHGLRAVCLFGDIPFDCRSHRRRRPLQNMQLMHCVQKWVHPCFVRPYRRPIQRGPRTATADVIVSVRLCDVKSFTRGRR